jgi:hypothetical protein
MKNVSSAMGLIALAAAAAAVSLPAHAADRCAKPKVKCVDITAINISGSSATVNLSVDPVLVLKGDKVIWKLPEGYVFDNQHQDAVVVNTSNGEIMDPSGESDDEDPTNLLSKRFKVKIKLKLVQAAGYKYTVTFLEMNGGQPSKTILCDPTIANFGGGATPGSKRKKPSPIQIKSMTCSVS